VDPNSFRRPNHLQPEERRPPPLVAAAWSGAGAQTWWYVPCNR